MSNILIFLCFFHNFNKKRIVSPLIPFLCVPVNAVGVAQIKINTTDHKTLDTATQLFLGTGNNANVVANVAIETLEGHQRAIIGNMTVEEMFRDKQKFSDEVKTTASADMLRFFLEITQNKKIDRILLSLLETFFWTVSLSITRPPNSILHSKILN